MGPWLSDRLLSSQSDERLAALASAGSERAFAVIVQRYRRPLLAFARHLAPSSDTEDLVQQTFMSALAAMRTGVEIRHLRGWLHQILRHAAVQASKRALVPAELSHADLATPSAQQAAEARMLTAEALAALARLPARQHEAMVATAIHGQSRAEVAQLLGLTEGAVRQLVHRARESLRAAVTAITPYPLAQALAAGSSGGGLADAVAGAGAGSVGALAVKIGAVVASGVVATGIVAAGNGSRSDSPHRAHRNTVGAVRASDPTGRSGDGMRLATLGAPGSTALRPAGTESGRGSDGGPGSSGRGGDGGSGTSSGSSPGGPSPSSGSSDGGISNSGSSGGPSATTATSSDGGGSGSSDGGMTTTTTTSGSGGGSSGGSGSSDGGSGSRDGGTTTTTTTTTTSGSDGGSSGGSGSGDTTTTTTTGGH